MKLRDILEERRIAAGNGVPLTWIEWGDKMGVLYTSLFKFTRGKNELSIKSLRTLAKRAEEANDQALLTALANYALDVDHF